MKPTRRGFFAALAALPVIVCGRQEATTMLLLPGGSLLPPSYQFVGGFDPGQVDFGMAAGSSVAIWVRTEFGWRCESPGVG